MSDPKDPFLEMLDTQIKGIQTSRDEMQLKSASIKAHLAAEWKKMVASAKALQARLAGHPKIQHFVISADESEISVKITDASHRRGFSYYILSCNHPDKKFPGLDAVWLCEFGEDDVHFNEPALALAELVSRMAPKIA